MLRLSSCETDSVTYHLAFVSDHFVQLVSDRLVTKTLNFSDYREHDPAANKTVALVARDGHLVLGYTGLAYLGRREKRTDEYIAESLFGGPSPPPTGILMFGDHSDPVPSLGYVFNRLRRDLDAALAGRPPGPAGQFEVLATCWSARDGPSTATVRLDAANGR